MTTSRSLVAKRSRSVKRTDAGCDGNGTEALQSALVGDGVRFVESRAVFTVQARDDRYLVCTRPFAPRKTVIYCVIDLLRSVRGPDDRVFCFGYETRDECEERLRDFNDPELDVIVSHRHGIPLRVDSVFWRSNTVQPQPVPLTDSERGRKAS